MFCISTLPEFGDFSSRKVSTHLATQNLFLCASIKLDTSVQESSCHIGGEVGKRRVYIVNHAKGEMNTLFFLCALNDDHLGISQ